MVESLFGILFDAVGSAVGALELFIILLEILFDIVSFFGLLRVSLQLKTIRPSYFVRPSYFRPSHFVRPSYFVHLISSVLFRPSHFIRLILSVLFRASFFPPSNLVRFISHRFYIFFRRQPQGVSDREKLPVTNKFSTTAPFN